TRQDHHGNWINVQKQSEGKSNRGGRKFAARRMDHDVASAEVVATGTEPNWDANHRPLLVKMVDGGDIDTRYTDANAVRDAAAHHRHHVSALHIVARRLHIGN